MCDLEDGRIRSTQRLLGEFVATKIVPGMAFSLVSDLGFAVGLVTHQLHSLGDLVWLAVPIFDEEPDVETVEGIKSWRWPVFFPTGAAVRRKIVSPIGVIEIPAQLRPFPTMRSGSRRMGWREVRYVDGKESVRGVASDASLPISQIVNDTILKEWLVSGWSPERDW
jgi:hypothetical protein